MKLLELEIWKPIPGYEGRYEASNMGRIRSVDRVVYSKNWSTGVPFARKIKGMILKPGRHSKAGHLSVVLGHGANGSPVHQLVMKTFVGEPPKGCEVLHSDGNPANNRLDNLRYGTRRENIADVYRQGRAMKKLTTEEVNQIRFGLATGLKGHELAEMYQVCDSTISEIKLGKTFLWLK